MVVYWFGDMLTFSKDINLATFLEANFQSDLNRLRQQDNANAWNERIKQYEDMAREKVQAFQADKKAATDYILGLLYESPNFEARKGRIDEWVDSKQHSVIIKRRELAKMIWDDHSQQLADSRNAINEWFRSPRGAGSLVFRPRRVKREE
ncbi:hypothetical protein F5Y13DRAFT_166729 [Hypoxylon sp. FL1857]|nr:hypothetical protein F5Y13DRAFT_166729 [Hypoxylon sp. FL1857]